MADRISVFLSYRRADTPHVSGRLGDRLAERYQLFMDIDNIRPGMDFTRVVREAVAECDVLLALIGRNWLNAVDPDGQRRLDSPRDWVVEEIRQGLQREITVIPVLVDGAVMPEPDEVPAALEQLTYRQALPLRHESFSADVGRLFDAIEHAVGPPDPATTEAAYVAPVELYKDLDYSRALAAVFNRRWDEAVRLLTSVAERFPDEPDLGARLTEATRQQAIARLEHEAIEAERTGRWREAIDALQRLEEADPRPDLALRLDAARRGLQVARLTDELRALHTAGEWRGVLATDQQLADLDPAAANPDGLASEARGRLAALELEDTYADGLRDLIAGRYDQARTALEQVAAREPGYRDAADLLAFLARRDELAQWHAVAAAAEQREDWDTAIAFLDRMVERDETFEQARSRRDQALQRRAELASDPPAGTSARSVTAPSSPVQPSPVQPSPVQPSPAQPSPTQPGPTPKPAPVAASRRAAERVRSSEDPVIAAGPEPAHEPGRSPDERRDAVVVAAVCGAVLVLVAIVLTASLDDPHELSHRVFPWPALLGLAGLVIAVVGTVRRGRASPSVRRRLLIADGICAVVGVLIGFLLVPVTIAEQDSVSVGFWLVVFGLPVGAGAVEYRVLRRRIGHLAIWPVLITVSLALFVLMVFPLPLHDIW